MCPSESPKTFCFDLDGTLCTNTWGSYERARPFPWAIERVNALADAGHRILIFTARGGTTGIDWRQTTESQLRDWGVRYDELILGKPQADLYVDDRTVHVDAWRYGEAFPVALAQPTEAVTEAMPALPPPRSATVVEIGRTFRGEPFRLEEHARRIAAAARQHGIVRLYSEAQICEAVRNAIWPSRDRLAPEDDLIFTIGLSGLPRSGYVDTIEDGLGSSLTIGCRLMSQAARGVGRYFREGAIGARNNMNTTPSNDAWPLHTDATGALRDMLGGEVVLISGDELRVRPQMGDPPVALAATLQFAAELGLGVQETAPTADEAGGADELLIIDLPFCLLPIGVLDDRRLTPAPGSVAVALARAWKDLTDSDPAAYWPA